MEIREISLDIENLPNYVSLMKKCFPGVQKYDLKYMRWLYRDNPDGRAIGFDAIEGGEIIAHYACIPAAVTVHGKKVWGLLSLNTATHPDFRGRGLFTKLADMTYQLADGKGYSCVYGVANASSTPGFVQKLDFQLVQSLVAKIGIGRYASETPSDDSQFKRSWTMQSLKWRCSNPNNPLFWKKCMDHIQFYAKSIIQMIPVYTEIRTDILLSPENNLNWVYFSPVKLFIGLVPEGLIRRRGYFSIPDRLKPSPLNFIFKSLDQNIGKLDEGTIDFSFLDFDAY